MHKFRSLWPVPAVFFILGLIPVVAGGVRLVRLAESAPSLHPVPVLVMHIFGASLFILGGAVQVWPMARARWPRWHRRAGRVLIVAALTLALAGLWMAFDPALRPIDGPLLLPVRLAVATAMVVCVTLGVVAIRRSNIARHRVWMIRTYALAMGTGLQVPLLVLVGSVVGPVEGMTRSLTMTAGWVLAVAVGEIILAGGLARRRPQPTYLKGTSQ
jgi:uncharacterized membrane protein